MQKIKKLYSLPMQPDISCTYYLPPVKQRDPHSIDKKHARFYQERTDRNNGYLVGPIEQSLLYDSSVAIIGAGGMGGYQDEAFLRLGIGHLYIADNGFFDESNINRQWAASRLSIGASKAFETVRKMRELADDTHVYVCAQGLCETTAEFLLKDRNVVVDMIEFWAIADRILLHRTCAQYGVVVINCNSVGHATFGSRYDYRTESSKRRLAGYKTLLERAMHMTYERARYLQTKYDSGIATPREKKEILEAIFRVFVPEETEYIIRGQGYSTRRALRTRLLKEGKAPIIAVNPLFAAGVCATEVYFEILQQL